MRSSRTFEQATITDEFAQQLLDAAIAQAESMGQQSVVAIVDVGGELKSFRRMDGAPKLSVQIAQDKAYTAIAFGMPTHTWHDFIKGDPPLLDGIVHTPRLIIFGGGYPITVDGRVIGGIGVSGGHYTDDMKIAEAALEIVGDGSSTM
ncbi:GlcG/HbpS family heme-binding protein [Mycolicibacterium smegmatis]|uniref:PduO protein n=1 Tax=Mycolicibacterium smegmatis (strain MKD8) TaxID=1214915 RepID=A0A2U9PKB4_MYCSE|nr:heme-binding protein [Mycolicibacterium smegmatis]AWT52183.1 PduO protein [Mycolicibacterium smegmatis MKD8]